MNLGNFSLRNLKQRDIAIIFVVLSIVAAVLWYFYMYQPTQDQIESLEADIQRIDQQIERGEAARRNLPDLRLAVAELEQDRREFLAQLPRESEVAALIDQLRVSASDADVIIQSFSQGGGQNEGIDDVRAIGFNVATNGTFPETMAFLGILEQLQRFTKINQVSLSVAEQNVDNPELNSNYNFTVYVFTGEDPGEGSEASQ